MYHLLLIKEDEDGKPEPLSPVPWVPNTPHGLATYPHLPPKAPEEQI